MTVSAISAVTFTGTPEELTSFIRAGVMYVAWHSKITDVGLSRLYWKPHTSANFTEVASVLAAAFHSLAIRYIASSDQLLVIWDDNMSQEHVSDGYIYSARINVLTGATVSGPTRLFQGKGPRLNYRTSGDQLSLYYVTPKTGGVYGRLSVDGGQTWQSGEPIITNQVNATEKLSIAPYDDTHISIAQLGKDAKAPQEIGMLQRSRPVSSIVKHPTLANKFFIGEPSKFDNTTLTDNLRGALVLATDNTKIYHLDGVVQGTSDAVGAVALVTVTGAAPAVTASAGPTGNGDDINSYTLAPAAGALNVDMPGASCAVDLAVSSAYGYAAEYADNSAVLGQLIVVDLATGTTGTVLSGVTAVRSVAVANFLATPIIFVATTESGVERLRVYQENVLTPSLLVNTKLPNRVNALKAVAHPTNPTAVRILVSTLTQFNIYTYYDPSQPIILEESYLFPGGDQFFRSAVTTQGIIVVAAGSAGVVILSATGKIKAQLRVSGKIVPAWLPQTAYTSGQLVRPTDKHPFTRNRLYFTCSSSGTSGTSEPSWVTAGTVVDATAQWQPVRTMDGVAVDVAVDEALQRIYVVGVAGGTLGTDGRLWVLSAAGLL